MTELSILWIVGALLLQQMIRNMNTVWWKEMLGIIFWPVVLLYVLYHIVKEKYVNNRPPKKD